MCEITYDRWGLPRVLRKKETCPFIFNEQENIGIFFKGTRKHNYCPFDIFLKDVFFFFFCLTFILDDNLLFWLTISYQKPFVFSVSLFCFQIFTIKFNLWPKVGLTYAISIVKWFFFNFCLRKYFLLFFAEFELLMFYNSIVKISEKLNKWNLLKIGLQVTYPTDFCMIWLHFYYGN